MIMATIFFGTINILVKVYSHIPAIQIVFFRSIITLFLSYYAIRKAKQLIFSKYTPTLLLRGLCGGIALILYFQTIQNIPLVSAVTILYLAPIFTVILSMFVLKEFPKPIQWPLFILCFVGAVMMKNGDLRVDTTNFIMGLSAALFAGMAYNLIRKLKGKVHHQLPIFYFPLVTIPLTLPFLFKAWVTPSFFDLLGLIAIGILTQLAQVCMTKAYMLEQASNISHYSYLTSLYALVCGYLFFGELISLTSLLGICILVGAILANNRVSRN